MKVSLTIPVYNTEEYLPQCVESLLNQSHKDWEAVFVDDGSTGRSVELLTEYAARDSRIRVIKMPENGGQAKARNAGLKYCTGDVISFLDSDDWLSDDAFASMVAVFEQFEDTDCVLYDCILKYPDREEPITEKHFDVLDGEEAAMRAITWDGIHGCYAVRTRIHLTFPYDETAKWYSDDNTSFMHFKSSRKVRYCMGKYYYRMREGSVTHNVSVHHFDILEAKESMRRILTVMGMYKKAHDVYEESRWLALIDCYMYYFRYRDRFSKADRQQIIQRIKAYWNNTDMQFFPVHYRHKFGFMHTSSWSLFVLQEEIYFTVRRLLGRLT